MTIAGTGMTTAAAGMTTAASGMTTEFVIAGPGIVIACPGIVIAGPDPQSSACLPLDPGSSPISANLAIHIPFVAVATCGVAARRGDGAMFATA